MGGPQSGISEDESWGDDMGAGAIVGCMGWLGGLQRPAAGRPRRKEAEERWSNDGRTRKRGRGNLPRASVLLMHTGIICMHADSVNPKVDLASLPHLSKCSTGPMDDALGRCRCTHAEAWALELRRAIPEGVRLASWRCGRRLQQPHKLLHHPQIQQTGHCAPCTSLLGGRSLEGVAYLSLNGW